jgi:hypothetical protein
MSHILILVTASKALSISLVFIQLTIIELLSSNSGLSVESLINIHGVCNIAHSSGTVPESVSIHNAFCSNFKNSLNPYGLSQIILSDNLILNLFNMSSSFG